MNDKPIIMDNSFLRGSISGLITCTLVQPLDVIKTNILTRSISHTISESYHYISSTFGPKGFWRGLRPAAFKAVLGSGMSFHYLETLKSFISTTGFASNSIIAMISRGFTIISLSPLSILKVRMEAPHAVAYPNLSEGIRRIYQDEGIKGYYKGLSSTLLRDLPFSGLAYAFYQFFVENFTPVLGYNMTCKGFSGVLAGFTSTLLTQPFDVIKTRQQFSHIGGNHSQYSSILNALYQIYKTEGLKGYTVGLQIRLIERSSGFSIVWLIYESLKPSQ